MLRLPADNFRANVATIKGAIVVFAFHLHLDFHRFQFQRLRALDLEGRLSRIKDACLALAYLVGIFSGQ